MPQQQTKREKANAAQRAYYQRQKEKLLQAQQEAQQLRSLLPNEKLAPSPQKPLVIGLFSCALLF